MWQRVSESGSVAERIVAQIEEMLAGKELKVGDQLPTERDLARLVGASRPTVREAIRILQTRGWVEVKHGHGAFIVQPPLRAELSTRNGRSKIDIDELYAMREVLEVPAATWAAGQAKRSDIATLKRILADLDKAFRADPADFRQLATLDASFHLTIADIAANSFLQQTSRVLHEILISGMETTLLIPGRQQKSKVQHERILAALAAHDPQAAGRAARAHVRSAHRAAAKRVAEETGQ